MPVIPSTGEAEVRRVELKTILESLMSSRPGVVVKARSHLNSNNKKQQK